MRLRIFLSRCLLLFAMLQISFVKVFACGPYTDMTLPYSATGYSYTTGLTIAANWNLKYNGPTSFSVSGALVVNGRLSLSNCQCTLIGDIIINSCGTLSFSNINYVSFQGHKIYVMPGGKLVLNNTVFIINQTDAYIAIESDYLHTNNDPDMEAGGIVNLVNSQIFVPGIGASWRGISVAGGNGGKTYGSYYSSSIAHSQYFSQQKILSTGKIYPAQLIMISSSIENMTEGIWNADKFGDPTYGKFSDPYLLCSGGGIIQMSKCIITNSANTTVNFYPYTNWQPGGSTITYPSTGAAQLSDKSFIRNSTFYNYYSSGFKDPAGTTTIYINTFKTHGISILGTIFKGDYSPPRWCAIGNTMSNININRACNDPYTTIPGACGGVRNTQLQNQDIAIHMYGSNGSNIQNIYIADTTGAVAGAYLEGINMQVSNNDIIANNIIKTSYSSTRSYHDYIIGLYMDGCSGYQVEGNDVNQNNHGDPIMGGIVSNESGTATNTIYRNTITNMDYCLQANGLNYNLASKSTGLKFICNDLSNNTSGVVVDASVGFLPPGGTSFGPTGIAEFQGLGKPTSSESISAGNLFASTSRYNLHNIGLNFDYYSLTSGSEYPNTVSTGVNIQPAHTGNSCPDNTACCDRAFPTGAMMTHGTYITHKAILETAIAAATPSTTDYEALLNQYSLLTDSIINSFLHAGDSILQYRGGESFRKYNVDTLYDSTHQSYFYDTTISYEDSTIRLNYDSVLLVLDSVKYLYDFKLREASIYNMLGRNAEALQTLNDIPGDFTLTSDETHDLNNLIFLYKIEDSLVKKSYQYDSLAGSDTTLIGSIARDSVGKARYMARGMLSMYHHDQLLPDMNIVPDTGGNKPAKPFINESIASIIVSPNPVKEILNISLKNCDGDMSAIIVDMNGRDLTQKVTSSGAGKMKLQNNNTNSFSVKALVPGVYFVKILDGKQVKEVDKIIKQ